MRLPTPKDRISGYAVQTFAPSVAHCFVRQISRFIGHYRTVHSNRNDHPRMKNRYLQLLEHSTGQNNYNDVVANKYVTGQIGTRISKTVLSKPLV